MSNKRKLQAEYPKDLRLKEDADLSDVIRTINQLVQTQSTFNKRFTEQHELQTGLKGTVVVAAPKKKDPRGKADPGLKLELGRIAEVEDPIADTDAVNLRSLKRLLTCSNLMRILSQCQDFDDAIEESMDDPACEPIELTNQKNFLTNLKDVHALQGHNEFLYVFGVDTDTDDI